MKKIVICKKCKEYEYYGKMRWIDGKEICRACYKSDYEHKYNKTYKWNDLDGCIPTQKDYKLQLKKAKGLVRK